MRDDLEWWFSNIQLQVIVIERGTPSEEIQTDSCLISWRAVFHGNNFGGRWTLEEKFYHTHVLKLMAMFLVVKALVNKFRNTHVKNVSNSSTAVFYIIIWVE
jgi:hypothetical protein